MAVLDTATGIYIEPERDSLLTPMATQLLTAHYLRDGETPQQGYARASRAWCGGDIALAQRLYNAVSKGWFMFASPVLSNAPLPGESIRGMPISCFLTYVPDTLEGLIDHSTEIRWLAVLGGGVGGGWSDVRSFSKKAPGPIPFIHTMDADMEAYQQGGTRRGSYAAYMNIDHPDIMEFLNIRRVGGDANRKCFSTGFHHGVNITNKFMQAVIADADWDLIDPHDKTVRDTVKAKMLWHEILDIRYRTGEPYLYFIDTAREAMPREMKRRGLTLHSSNLCSEITLPTDEKRTAVCCLSSLNAEKYDEWRGTTLVADLIRMLDNVLSYFIENAPSQLAKAVYSASRERSLGLGVMGFHAYLQKKMVAFESQEAREINQKIFRDINVSAMIETYVLGSERGEAPDMEGSGRRNAHLLAIAPNANSAILLATSPSIEPAPANAYTHETRVGSHLVKNRYLESLLEEKSMNIETVWQSIITNNGSVQHLDFLTDHEKDVFKTAIELNQHWVVRHAADRQPYICQAQSLNLFFPPKADKSYFEKVHMAAFRLGLKSLYYCRSMASKRVENVSKKVERVPLKDAESAEECVACQG